MYIVYIIISRHLKKGYSLTPPPLSLSDGKRSPIQKLPKFRVTFFNRRDHLVYGKYSEAYSGGGGWRVMAPPQNTKKEIKKRREDRMKGEKKEKLTKIPFQN